MTDELKATARAAGADLVGVADLGPFKAKETLLPPDVLDRFTKAVSVAVHLDDKIVGAIEGAPTPDYAKHYRAVNATLDRITDRLANWVISRSYSIRDQALHFGRCVEQTREFKARPGIGAQVCGVCVKVCPFGRP